MAGGSTAKKPKRKQLSVQNENDREKNKFDNGSKNNSDSNSEEDVDYGKRKTMDDTLTEVLMNMQKFDYDMFEMKDKYDEAITKIKSLEDTVECLQDKLKEEQNKTSLLIAKNNDLEQYSRRHNIRVFGISDSGRETAEKSEKLVTDLIKNKLSLNITPNQVQVAHRAGKFQPGGTRSIIMQFVSRKDKQQVMSVRKKLKGSGISIAEDLTPVNVRRLSDIKKLEIVQEAWSSQGKLFAKKADQPEVVKEIPSQLPINENIFDRHTARGQQQQQPPQSSRASASAASATTTAAAYTSVSVTTTTAASEGGAVTSSQTTSLLPGPVTSSITNAIPTVTSLASSSMTSSQTAMSSKTQMQPSVKSASGSADKTKSRHDNTPASDTDMDTSVTCEKPTPRGSSTPKTQIQLRLEDMALLNQTITYLENQSQSVKKKINDPLFIIDINYVV